MSNFDVESGFPIGKKAKNNKKCDCTKVNNCLVHKGSIAIYIILASIGLLLMLILVPLSFSYVEWDEMAFKKNVLTNVVDDSQVYLSGRYLWGPTFEALTFPRTFQLIQYRNNDLLIFSGKGLEFSIEIDVYYKLDPQKLQQIFSNFGTNYHERFKDAIRASLKNSAPLYSVDDYITKREEIIQFMFVELNHDLEPFNLSIELHKLLLHRIIFPEIIKNKFLQTAVQVLNNKKSQLEQEVEIILKNTETLIENINANITIVNKSAIAQANTIVVSSEEEAKNIVQKAVGTGINSLMTAIGAITSDTRKDLFSLLTVQDGETLKTLVGDLSAIITT